MHATFPSTSSTEHCWVADIEAMTHMTSDLSHLHLITFFSGKYTVTTADGIGLPISHIGTSSLSVFQCSLRLNEVLHVPQISHNLLSVHRLCKNNNCRFICDAFGFWSQDNTTGTILLKGLCKAGLYPIPFSFVTFSH